MIVRRILAQESEASMSAGFALLAACLSGTTDPGDTDVPNSTDVRGLATVAIATPVSKRRKTYLFLIEKGATDGQA